jgi:hypothetical protein
MVQFQGANEVDAGRETAGWGVKIVLYLQVVMIDEDGCGAAGGDSPQ